jgi:hypothetical protein
MKINCARLTVFLMMLVALVLPPVLGAEKIPGPGSTNCVSVTIGPVPVPNVPVEVCINNSCTSTPVLTTLELKVTACAETTVGIPTVTTSHCPRSAVGGGVTITTGGTNATVTVTVSGKLPDGTPYSQTIGPTTVLPLSTVAVTACAS